MCTLESQTQRRAQAGLHAAVELSVVICTRDRREHLERALESLRSQESDRSWEVLVVDNGSGDGTLAWVEGQVPGYPVPLRVVSEPRRGLSHARNRALRDARGRAVVYLDDDATCRRGWVQGHASAFARPDVVATGGRILPVFPPGTPAPWRALLLAQPGGPTGYYDFGPEPRDIVEAGSARLPFGGNLGVIRALGLEIGGFRTDLGWGSRLVPGEETEFLWRLQARGGRIAYVPSATVDHHLTLRQVSLDHFRRWHRGYGRFIALVVLEGRPLRRLLEIGRQAFRIALGFGRARAARRRGDLPAEIEGLRDLERSTGCLLQLLHL